MTQKKEIVTLCPPVAASIGDDSTECWDMVVPRQEETEEVACSDVCQVHARSPSEQLADGWYCKASKAVKARCRYL